MSKLPSQMKPVTHDSGEAKSAVTATTEVAVNCW